MSVTLTTWFDYLLTLYLYFFWHLFKKIIFLFFFFFFFYIPFSLPTMFSQTRAQLAVDPDNEELKVLEQNYIELIELAEEDQASAAGGGAADAAGSAVGGTASASWAVGGKCQAPFQGVSYVAVIDAIDGAAVTVTFDGYGNTETVDVSTLQPPGSALPAGATAASHAAAPAAAAVTAAGGGSETAAGASKKRSHDETAAVGKDGKTKEEREAEREKKKKKREKRKEKDEASRAYQRRTPPDVYICLAILCPTRSGSLFTLFALARTCCL